MHESDRRYRDLYNRIAPFYDWFQRVGSLLRGFSDSGERRKMVSRLELKPGRCMLEVSVGTGANLPLVAEDVGPEGRMVGLDISSGMLRQCQKKLGRRRLPVDLIEGEAAHLPFAANSFDALLHFGGINEFDDKKKAIDEMMRVARPGARIVISDEGLAPGARRSLRNRLLLRVNPLYAHEPPTDLIPPEAQDLHLTWFRADGCYLIDFVNP